MKGDNDFFDSSSARSKVKTEIVSRYFWVWASIILSATKGKVAYIDLYSGPGAYEDGTKSTPIRILENAINCDGAERANFLLHLVPIRRCNT